jgi:type III secretion protein L
MGPREGDATPRIVKGGGRLSPPGGNGGAARRLPAEVHAAVQRARGVLAAAEAEARRIREAAEAESQRVVAAAEEAGRQEGLARAAVALAAAAAERDRLLASAEPELVRLALAVASRVVAREVALDMGVVTRIASEALEAARERCQVVVRVAPADAAALRAEEPRLLQALGRARSVEIREDPAIGRGGVVVETEAGTVDARIETRLETLRRALLGEEAP